MTYGANQDGLVMVERSDRMWSTGEGNGKPLQYSCLENPMNSMKREKDRTLKDELPRSVGAQYATGDQWRNNSRKNEGMEPKQKQHPVVNGTGDRSKIRCCKEQYCVSSVQFSRSVMPDSVIPLTSMPGLPVLHHLPELAQTHVHSVSDAIQPSHPLTSPSPPALNLSQDQGLF